jgi:hypothetical protein
MNLLKIVQFSVENKSSLEKMGNRVLDGNYLKTENK